MRRVRISSVNFHKGYNQEEGLARAKEHIHTALLQQPDLILLPECFANSIETAEPVSGPIIKEMAKVARENCCYVVAPLYEETDGIIYNSSVLIDRQGEVSAIYHKYFPTDYEMKSGVKPGEQVKAITTDFGRIGLAICFDLNFREVIQQYADSGTELILWSSAYEGGRQLAGWALEYSMYVVSSYWGGTGYIIDKTGHVLESADTWRHPVATRVINLDSYVFHLDYNFHFIEDILKEFGPKVHIHADVPEGRMTIESLCEDVDVLDIKMRYDLEFFSEYLDRTREVRRQALEDKTQIGRYMRQGQV